MKKLSNITESIFNAAARRSVGLEIRKEDSKNYLTLSELKKYLEDNYEITSDFVDIDVYDSSKTSGFLSVPIYKDSLVYRIYLYLSYNDNTKKIVTNYLNGSIKINTIGKINPNIFKDFDFVTKDNANPVKIEYKYGDITNDVFLKLIDLIIENTPEENIIIKKRT